MRRLLFPDGSDHELLEDQPTTVGSSPDASLRIDDPSLAEIQVALEQAVADVTKYE